MTDASCTPSRTLLGILEIIIQRALPRCKTMTTGEAFLTSCSISSYLTKIILSFETEEDDDKEESSATGHVNAYLEGRNNYKVI